MRRGRKRRRDDDYGDVDFARDISLSNMAAFAPKNDIPDDDIDRPSYELGAFDAYSSIASILAKLRGNETDAQFKRLVKAAQERLNRYFEEAKPGGQKNKARRG